MVQLWSNCLFKYQFPNHCKGHENDYQNILIFLPLYFCSSIQFCDNWYSVNAFLGSSIADKNALTQHEKAITTLDVGVEGMKLITEENKVQLASMRDTISLLAESNKGLRQDFQTLIGWVKKDHLGGEMSKALEMGEGSSSIPGRISSTGKALVHLQTPTRFGTINEKVVLLCLIMVSIIEWSLYL